MLRKIVSLLAISPLALNLIATTPSTAQQSIEAQHQRPTNGFKLSCNQLIFEGAKFQTQATYPRDPNLYTGPLRITRVHGSKWVGRLNLNNYQETVEGRISGTRFTLKRRSGQNWSASCTAGGGIYGTFTKKESRAVGSFTLTPNFARR
ncbi:hypothetical protein NIES2119_21885 [[Phormidium ambiguum] IAM M-71]|uniref:Uncharacterized protein n=1 Tax=[Phormidium ambiguum] IAM M-71 TaxID=454136 RepID=A0A1U7IBC0_9CYAN|nr:hypothetical protein [Phormidium ambiguum]OKH33944.1 hypothetical protein NIES2119_21885 [Phormidium ambiguum IAM M-71]